MDSEENPNQAEDADSDIPPWEMSQLETFTAWVNDRLKSGDVNADVKDILTQFADGITLIKLLEVLAPNKKMPR